MHVWNWLRAWGVPDPVVDALFTAGVDGKQFISLYRDACHKVVTRPSGPCWSAIVGEGDPASMEAKLDPVMRAGEYAEGADFLLPPGDWVRGSHCAIVCRVGLHTPRLGQLHLELGGECALLRLAHNSQW